MSYQPGSRVIYRTPTAFSTPPEDYMSIQSQIGSNGEIIQINSSNPTVQLPSPSSVDYLISTASSSLQHSEDFLNQSINLLRPNSILILREPLIFEESNDTNINTDFGLRSLRDLRLALTLAGFVDINAKQQNGDPAEIKVGSSSFKVAMYEISCKKPSWEIGSSLSLGSNSSSQSLKRKSNSLHSNKESFVSSKPAVWKLDDDDTIEEEFAAKLQPQSQSNRTTKNAWKLPVDQGEEGDDDLMDEDELLKGEDLVIPTGKKVKTKDGDDCELGKGGVKKACKNCTCGRAELEIQQAPTMSIKPQEVVKQVEIVKQVNSSCGNCYLGDAFRCGGCPYRGLPAFKPGEKITIEL